MENNNFIKNDPKMKKKSQWTVEQEELLAEWAEKAACYRWLHSKSEKVYTKSHYNYSIPIIILSTLTGTANFGIESVPKEYTRYAQMAIGGVNLFAGILGTLQNFFRYAELMEAHRSVEILWSKFQREISVELALDPRRRKDADEFLAISRTQFDKLIEQSPPIPEKIINLFKTTFKKTTNIHKPDICNGIDPCNIYKPSKDEKVGNVLAIASNKFKNKNTINKFKVDSTKFKFDEARKKLSSELHKKEFNDNISDIKENMSDIKENIVLENVSTLKENMFKKLDNQSKKIDVNKEENIIDNELVPDTINIDVENP